jgi:hypothetical protein
LTPQKYFLVAVLLLFSAVDVLAQCSMLPNAFEQKLEQADKVLEGRVVAQTSTFGENGQIYTTNQIEVYRVFKGIVGFHEEFITEGGIVGELMQVVTPSVQLKVGDYGLFSETAGFATEFVRIDEQSNTVYGVKYINDREALYEKVAREIGSETIELRRIPQDLMVVKQMNLRAQPQISSITPQHVTAGTQTLLTISGSGFGTQQGSGHVAFTNADDGGQSFVALQAGPHYLSWTDTEIQLYVPSATLFNTTIAGSGNVRVQNADGNIVSSTEQLTIDFAKSEVIYDEELNETMLVGMQNGGYEFSMNLALQAFLPSSDLVANSIEKWACNTGVRFSLANQVVAVSDWGHDDVNLLGMSQPGQLPQYLLGKTITTFSGCGTPEGMQWNLIEVDVLLNSDIDWWIGQNAPLGNRFDLATSLLHELGHAHLLQHNNDLTSPMYFELTAGSARTNLSVQSDIDGGMFIANQALFAQHTCGDEPHQQHDFSTCNLSVINSLAEADTDELQAYPNPFKDELIITTADRSQSYRLLDATGRLVKAGTINNSEESVSTALLSSGIYFLEVLTDKTRTTVRLVKN